MAVCSLVLGGAHVADLRFLQVDVLLKVGDALGHLAGQVHVALLDGGPGRALVLGDLVAEAGDFLLQDAAAGHQGGHVVAGLALGGVRVADFLVEDANGVGVDDGRGGLVRAGATQGEQLVPDGHGRSPRGAN
jgi:hypothetical protein